MALAGFNPASMANPGAMMNSLSSPASFVPAIANAQATGNLVPAAFLGSSEPAGAADNSSTSAAPVAGSPLATPKAGAPAQKSGGLSPQAQKDLASAGGAVQSALNNLPVPTMVQANAPAVSAPMIPQKQGEVGQLAAALSNPALANGVKFGG